MASVILGMLWILFAFLALKIAIEVSSKRFLQLRATYKRCSTVRVQLTVWLCLILIGFCFGSFFIGFPGMILTLALPLLCYLFSFAAFLSEQQETAFSKKLLNGLFAIISTLTFWNLTVTPANWNESGLIFVAIIPIFLILLMTTVIAVHFISKLNLQNTLKVAGSSFVFLMVSTLLSYRAGRQENLEVHNKLELARVIVAMVKANRPLVAAEFANSDRIRKMYSQRPNGILENKYGGEILIDHTAEKISIKYTKVPAGEPCHSMYFINHPSTYGFKETFVNGIRVPNARDVQNEKELDERLCFSNLSPKTIEFRATKEDLLQVRDDSLN